MFAQRVAKGQTKAAESPTKLASQRSTRVTRPFDDGAVEQAHMPQWSIGNHGTLRLLPQRAWRPAGNETGAPPVQETERMHMPDRAAAPGLSWDFSKIPIFPPDRTNRPQTTLPPIAPLLPSAIQPKLIVGQVDDPLEHEADRVADHVMRMPDPFVTELSAGKSVVRRKCAACDEDAATLRPKLVETLHHTAGEHTADASGSVRGVLSAPGEPLGATTRAFFEPRFGRDFSAVRIHTGEEATRSARSIGALAYTFGPHIVFAQGRYEPNSASGRHLLAHELTHTIQQQSGGVLQRAVSGAAFGVSEWDALDSEPLQPGSSEGAVTAEEESSRPDVAVSAKRDGVIQRTPSSCPPYDGYSATRRVGSYNCAGLAHRTYDFKSLVDTQALLTGGAGTACGTVCTAGKVKHWLWRYDIHLEDSSGTSGPTSRDFHTVAGVSTGADPIDVFTKNGARAIHGPGTGPSFRPPARDQATSNDPSETPVVDSAGRPIFKVRQNFAESCHCLNCPSTAPPEAGPPLPG